MSLFRAFCLFLLFSLFNERLIADESPSFLDHLITVEAQSIGQSDQQIASALLSFFGENKNPQSAFAKEIEGLLKNDKTAKTLSNLIVKNPMFGFGILQAAGISKEALNDAYERGRLNPTGFFVAATSRFATGFFGVLLPLFFLSPLYAGSMLAVLEQIQRDQSVEFNADLGFASTGILVAILYLYIVGPIWLQAKPPVTLREATKALSGSFTDGDCALLIAQYATGLRTRPRGL